MFEDPAAEWPLLPLSDFIQRLDTGVSVNSEDRPHGAGEVGVLKTSALSGSAFNANENKAVLPEEQRLVAEPVSGNSILISRMNTPELVGVACYVRHPYPDLFLPDRIWQAKKKHGCDLDMRWLSYQLQTEGYRRFLGAHATGTSGSMKNLPKSSFLGMRLHFPKADEQRLIASILDTLDTQIQKTEALIAKLEKVKEGLLHDLLTRGIDENGRLRPSPNEAPELYKESPLGLIPREWQYGQLKDFGQLTSGQHIPGELSNRDGRGVPYFTGPTDFYSGKTVTSSHTEFPQVMCSAGDLLITVKGSGCGKTAIAETDACISRQLMAFNFKEPEKGFWRAFFSSNEKMINKIAEGGAIPGISRQQLLHIPTACPKAKYEFNAISKIIAEHEQRQFLETRQLKKLKKQKTGLMDDLLTGRVRVTPLLDQAQATTPA